MGQPAHKVLIVDEDVLLVLEAERVLCQAYRVSHLTSPSGFWAKVDYERPDVLLVDITMRMLDTDDVLERLRTDDSYADLAIVLFSNKEADELQQLCVDNDINGYFCKSQEIAQLPEFLENFLE